MILSEIKEKIVLEKKSQGEQKKIINFLNSDMDSMMELSKELEEINVKVKRANDLSKGILPIFSSKKRLKS